MIYVKLMGGLGNQMFQYAFGKAFSLKHKIPFAADLSFYEETHPLSEVTPREFEIDVFNIHFDSIVKKEPYLFFEHSLLKRVERKLKANHFLDEVGFDFQENLLSFHDDVVFKGYFQTEKYFFDIRNVLLQDFTPRSSLTSLSLSYIEEAHNVESVSIHIRRGDYVTSSYHHSCDLLYYSKAIHLIAQKKSNLKLYIFSDDIAWVKNELQFDFPCVYVEHNVGKKSFEDLMIMKACKHNIIANSSFSWWGAWLGEQQDKIVVAPLGWFKKGISSKDLVPERWVRI